MRLDLLLFPSEPEWPGWLGPDGVAREAVGRVAEQDLAASATLSSRCATLTASPAANEWPRMVSPAITSPLLTPMRTAIWTP